MARSTQTRDHDEIRRWAEEHGGIPTRVKGTGGLLRIDFVDGPKSHGRQQSLEEIDWDDWFETFDGNNLVFLHGEGDSKFFKLVYPETLQRKSRRRGSSSRSNARSSSRRASGRGRSARTGGRRSASTSARGGTRSRSGGSRSSGRGASSRGRGSRSSGRRGARNANGAARTSRRSAGSKRASTKSRASSSRGNRASSRANGSGEEVCLTL
jgi:hypothetical protein